MLSNIQQQRHNIPRLVLWCEGCVFVWIGLDWCGKGLEKDVQKKKERDNRRRMRWTGNIFLIRRWRGGGECLLASFPLMLLITYIGLWEGDTEVCVFVQLKVVHFLKRNMTQNIQEQDKRKLMTDKPSNQSNHSVKNGFSDIRCFLNDEIFCYFRNFSFFSDGKRTRTISASTPSSVDATWTSAIFRSFGKNLHCRTLNPASVK